MSTRKDSNYNIDNDPYHVSHYQAAGIDTNKIGFWKSSEAKTIFKRVANKQNIGNRSMYSRKFANKHNERIINWQKDEFMKTPGGVEALTQSQEDIQAMFDNEAELDAIRAKHTVDGSVSVPNSSTTTTTVSSVNSAGNPAVSTVINDDGNEVTTFADGSTQVGDANGTILSSSGKPRTERDTFASDGSLLAQSNQAYNDAADAQIEASELRESAGAESDAYKTARAKADALTARGTELKAEAEAEAEDEADTDMFQADFDRENLDDEFASRPEPSVSELRGVGTSKDDWRVRLRLAPQGDYLYNAPDPGILAPLVITDGIIFPYVPRIDTVHQARYNNYDLPHSNYRGYFYAGSHQERVIVSATFTAQDTKEANYMLAALHFLRSCTKMFYGQDMHRGTPPPLVFLSGLGEHQFNEHPCAVEIVNINLPNDVDYIKAGDSGTFSGDFMSPINSPRTSPASSFSGALSRLFGAGMSFGGTPAPTYTRELIYQRENQGITMVPTKMDINFNLVPIQTRDQISNEYSLKDYASGSLLKKGFW